MRRKKAYTGFAKTIKAYQLLMNLNLTDSNGIRVDVADPDNLGPIVDYRHRTCSYFIFAGCWKN